MTPNGATGSCPPLTMRTDVGSGTTVMTTNLAPNMDYRVQVRAKDEGGWAWSASGTGSTNANAPT